MKNYYTYYPLCPNCLEPAKSDKLLIKDEIFEDMFFCPSCGGYFKNIVNIDSRFSFPLFKDIKLNIIEESYIDWIINSNCNGKYFITWPWDNVKFIPIFVMEYIAKNPDDKIVIFYNEDNNKMSELNFSEVLDYLFYLDETIYDIDEILFSNEDVFVENLQGYCELFINLFDEKSIENFNRIKSNLTDITFISDDLDYYNHIKISCGFVDESEGCFKRFIDTFKELFGEDSIKCIHGLAEEFKYNDSGLFELNFTKEYSLDDNLKFNKNFSDNTNICFENRYDLLSGFFNVNYQIINSEDVLDEIDYDNSIFFINQNILFEELVEHIYFINPNWILFNSIDQALAKSRYNKFMRNNLFSLLGSNVNILLFSTDLSRRSGYQIGKKGFIKNMGIIPHTWDYKEILDEICNNYENDITLFSSNLNNIHGNYSLKITFHECDKLKIMDECLNIFNEVFRGNKDVLKFIRELIRTPLYIKGDYEKLFRRQINLEYLLAIVFNHDESKWEYLIDSLDDVYGWASDNKNPLLDEIINLINRIQLNDDKIAIVVHHWDINQVKKILLEKLPDNEILVTRWTKLNEEIVNTPIKQVIATEFPTWSYNLYDSPLDEIIIVGSLKTIETYKLFKNNRFTEEGTKPLYILSENEDAPNLLKELLSHIEVPADDIEDFNEEVNKIRVRTTNHSKNTYNYQQNNIKKGSSAILVLNKNKEAMFLPYKTIYIHNGERIDGISMYNGKNYEKLINTDILINEQEMYYSFGRLFFKFIIENGNDLIISDGKYEWKGFKALIENMFEWCDILHKIVNMESLDDKKSRSKTKQKLEDTLKEEGVKRSNNYIRNFWLDDPIPLNTSEGELLIYEIEHPRNSDDLFKIYEWISDNYDEFGVSGLDADRVYSAGNKIQNIRPKFFKNKFNETDQFRELCDGFQDFIKDKINTSNLFHVSSAELVDIVEDVEPYKILDEYGNYYKLK